MQFSKQVCFCIVQEKSRQNPYFDPVEALLDACSKGDLEMVVYWIDAKKVSPFATLSHPYHSVYSMSDTSLTVALRFKQRIVVRYLSHRRDFGAQPFRGQEPASVKRLTSAGTMRDLTEVRAVHMEGGEGGAGMWCKSGYVGFMHDDELFVVGRQERVIRVHGSTLVYEDLIEAAVSDFLRERNVFNGRVCARHLMGDTRPLLVVIILVPAKINSPDELTEAVRTKVGSTYCRPCAGIIILQSTLTNVRTLSSWYTSTFH